MRQRFWQRLYEGAVIIIMLLIIIMLRIYGLCKIYGRQQPHTNTDVVMFSTLRTQGLSCHVLKPATKAASNKP